MSEWSHPICYLCWTELNPHREPHRLVTPIDEKCCYCGKATRSGIYVREDPAALPKHVSHSDAV